MHQVALIQAALMCSLYFSPTSTFPQHRFVPCWLRAESASTCRRYLQIDITIPPALLEHWKTLSNQYVLFNQKKRDANLLLPKSGMLPLIWWGHDRITILCLELSLPAVFCNTHLHSTCIYARWSWDEYSRPHRSIHCHILNGVFQQYSNNYVYLQLHAWQSPVTWEWKKQTLRLAEAQ